MTRLAPRALVAAMLMPALAGAQRIDTVAFRLHKFKQPIGWERDTIRSDSASINASMHFLFVDRGTPVPLVAHWIGAADFTPSHFDIKGNTSRLSTINDTVESDTVLLPTGSRRTRITSGAQSKIITMSRAERAFTIGGYAPVLMQECLVGYWQKHGKPTSLSTTPVGEVHIVDRGRDTIAIAGAPHILRRYAINGLIWGGEKIGRASCRERV